MTFAATATVQVSADELAEDTAGLVDDVEALVHALSTTDKDANVATTTARPPLHRHLSAISVMVLGGHPDVASSDRLPGSPRVQTAGARAVRDPAKAVGVVPAATWLPGSSLQLGDGIQPILQQLALVGDDYVYVISEAAGAMFHDVRKMSHSVL